MARDAVEVERRRSRWRRRPLPFFGVDGHAGPRVGAAFDLVGVLRPRRRSRTRPARGMVWKIQRSLPVFTSKARMWPGDPGSVSGTLLPMISRSSKIDAGRAGADAQLLRRLIETFTQVDAAVGAEGLDRLAGLLVQRPEKAAVADEDAILVHRDAAVPEARRPARAVARIELPDLVSGRPHRPQSPSASASWRRARRRRRSGCSASRSP